MSYDYDVHVESWAYYILVDYPAGLSVGNPLVVIPWHPWIPYWQLQKLVLEHYIPGLVNIES